MRPRHLAWLTLVCWTICGFAFAADTHYFDSDGVNIRYYADGQGDALVLIHGFSGSAETAWIKPGVFDALVNAGFHVIALDNRGHGGSDKPHDPASYGVNMAEDVRRLLDHLGTEKAHVVGYSMGGIIANTFRARHPERLITATLGGSGWPWRRPVPTLEESLENLRQRDFNPGNDINALAAYGVARNDLIPSEENMRSNRVPTLSIVGTDDPVARRDNSVKTLRETLANLEVVDMPGTHAGPDGVLYKAEFADAVIAFIRGNN